MADISRRDLIRSVGAGALACAAGSAFAGPALGRGGRGRARVPRASRVGRASHADVIELAQRIVRTPRAKCFDLAEERLRAGVDWRDLEAAIFLAGLYEISPRPPGSLLHAVLVVESVYQLAEASPEDERLLPVLFNLDDVKASQESDVDRADWTLPARPDVAATDRGAAGAELARALADFDGERADRAVTALFALGGEGDALEIAWAHVVGDLGSLGHKVIYAAQAERTLSRLEATAGGTLAHEVAEPALRSLVWALTNPSPQRDVEDAGASREIAATLPDDWRDGAGDAERSLATARALLASDPAGARARLVEGLRAKLGIAAAWDAIRLAACDLFARGPGLLPVHPTTIANALHHVYRSSQVEATSRVALLQAAAWIPRLREALANQGRISRDELALDALLVEPGEGVPTLAETFAEPTPLHVRTHLEGGQPYDAFASHLRSHLFRGVAENHQAKYAAALLEDARLCHPRWRSVLLAPAFGYLPSARTPATAVYERSRELIARLRSG